MVLTSSQGWIGIDVGTRTLKLAQVERKGTQIRLQESVVVPRSTALSEADTPPALSEEIRAALSLGEHFRGAQAASILPLALCELHALEVNSAVPERRRALLAAMFGSGVRPEQQIEFDYWSLDRPGLPSLGPDNVYAIAVERRTSDWIADQLVRAGTSLQLLDGEPLALARALEFSRSPDGPRAALDWGFGHIVFTVASAGHALYVRQIRAGGLGELASAVSKGMSIPVDDAATLLNRHGVGGRDGSANHGLAKVIARAASDVMAAFVTELTKTITFLRTQRPALVPSGIEIFGGGATLPRADQYLADHLQIPVRKWRPDAETQAATATDWTLLGPAVALSSLSWQS